MSEQKTQFIIDTDGRFFRVDSTKVEIDPGPELEKCFKTNMSVKLPKLMVLPGWGAVSVSVDEQQLQHWSVEVKDITFKTSYRIKGEGETAELIPLFMEKSDTAVSINWVKDDAMAGQKKSMELRFVAVIQPQGPGAGFKTFKQYLYAFDGSNAYRLPISNLYDTGELCNGTYESLSATSSEALIKALNQFRTSSWNSDLWKDETIVENFIRFKPLETGFKTLPIKSNWTQWCRKISTPLLKHVII